MPSSAASLRLIFSVRRNERARRVCTLRDVAFSSGISFAEQKQARNGGTEHDERERNAKKVDRKETERRDDEMRAAVQRAFAEAQHGFDDDSDDDLL